MRRQDERNNNRVLWLVFQSRYNQPCYKLVELYFSLFISKSKSLGARLKNSVTIMGVERERSKLLPTFLISDQSSSQPCTSLYNDTCIYNSIRRLPKGGCDCSETLCIHNVMYTRRWTEAVRNFRPRGGCRSGTNRLPETRVESAAGKLLICPKVRRAGARNARATRLLTREDTGLLSLR